MVLICSIRQGAEETQGWRAAFAPFHDNFSGDTGHFGLDVMYFLLLPATLQQPNFHLTPIQSLIRFSSGTLWQLPWPWATDQKTETFIHLSAVPRNIRQIPHYQSSKDLPAPGQHFHSFLPGPESLHRRGDDAINTLHLVSKSSFLVAFTDSGRLPAIL